MEMKIPEMQEIRDELKHLQEMFSFVLTAGKDVVTVKDIARLEGTSYSSIMHGKDMYLLPRFGQSAYPTGPKRWPVEEYFRWKKIPPTQRLEMYREHLLQMRKQAVRKANSTV